MRNDERQANAAMTEDTNSSYRIAYPRGCSGACEGNTGECPSKEACHLSEPESLPTPMFRWLGAALAIVVAAIVFALMYGVKQ